MRIIEMSFENLEQVTELAVQLGYPFPLEEIQRRFAALSKSPMFKLYVAEDDGHVVGWIQINKETESLLSDPRAEVTALVVDEKCRGRGIGRMLLAKAEAWALENELLLVRLVSNTIRTEAHQFYLRQGYSIKKSWHLFVKSL